MTRPESQARHWVDALVQRGWDAHALPLIDIVPTADPRLARTAWNHLDTCAAVMFVSASAVRHFFALRPQGLSWPGTTRAWAPGPGTGAALAEAGLPAPLIDAPAPDAPQFDSESLWDKVAAQARSGARVLIVRGGDAAGGATGTGRDWLGRQLAAAGVRVESLAVYTRQAPRWSPAQFECARQGARGVWLFSSSQAIANLLALLPGQDWASAKALATHPRIAQAARRAGFGVVCESRPSLAAVAAALESIQ